MAILSWGKPVGSRIMRKLGSCLREQTDVKEEIQTEDNSRLRGVESQLRTAAQLGYPNPEDAEDPMIAPPHYDVRQPGRVLELQNRDLWLRPTDLSWHLPILTTIREEPCKNSRARRQWRTRWRRPRSRRLREAMMNGILPNGNHHLGHGNNLLHPGKS